MKFMPDVGSDDAYAKLMHQRLFFLQLMMFCRQLSAGWNR